MPIGWDHPDTARYYEAFCRGHQRYADANRALIAGAELRPGLRVLDLAAGIGGTAAAALELGVDVTCYEPAQAMRNVGKQNVPQAQWVGDWPGGDCRFDRILCGAAIWQMLPLAQAFARAALALNYAGVFAFNIPSLYLGEADPPGGGRDPWLLELLAKLSPGREICADTPERVPAASEIDLLLAEAGFTSARWCHRGKLTQADMRAWMKIPPLTDVLLNGLSADERAARVDAAYSLCDPESWRWEIWSGWTAWKR